MARSESSSVAVSRRGSARGDAESTVVWVRGEHDIATKGFLAATIARAAQLDDAPLLVDLSGVTFMDASTVAAIVGSRNRLRSRAQSLELRAPSPRALRVLQLCGLAHLVHCEPLRPTGVAAALSTWVDVPPIDPGHGTQRDAARDTPRPKPRQAAGVPAASDAHTHETVATIAMDRGGP